MNQVIVCNNERSTLLKCAVLAIALLSTCCMCTMCMCAIVELASLSTPEAETVTPRVQIVTSTLVTFPKLLVLTNTSLPTETKLPTSMATGSVMPAVTTELSLPTVVLPTSAIIPTQPLLTKSPTEPPVASIALVSLTSPIPAGSSATLAIQVMPSAVCDPGVVYKSGESKADGLGSKTADSNGYLSWTWKIGSKTTPGTWKVYVRCSPGGYMKWNLVVQ